MKITQSCPTGCDPWTTVHGILQARILEWVAFPFSKGSSQPKDRTQVSHIAGRFFTSWATREVQEYWGGQPIPLQRTFLTQESNCRWILYQLSYEESPKCKDIPYLYIGSLGIIHMSFIPKLICNLNVMSIKIPENYSFLNIQKSILSLYEESKGLE